MAKPIYFFQKGDPYFELSNFYPQGFKEGDAYWPSVEHFFQAQKFLDMKYQEKIRNCGSPKSAKTLGQSRKHKIRDDWENIKEDVMLFALKKKFADPVLKEILMNTKKRLLFENSPYDKYWGIGRNGKGKNRLGELLMKVRRELE